MDQTEPPPDRPDPAIRLPTATYYQVLHTLRGYLPPPITDTPQDHTRRDDAAIAQVAAMLPVNADEAHLAAQCVGARAQATDCLRLARVHEADVTRSLQCTAQAARMMREANGSRTLLLRVQAERRRLEADSAAADTAAWTEHCVIGWMTQAATGGTLEPMPPPPPPPPPSAAAESDPDTEPVRGLAAEAEQYAMIYPDRAGLIRAHGGVPDSARFGPPDDALVRAIVAGRTPALLEADRLWAKSIRKRDAVSANAV